LNITTTLSNTDAIRIENTDVYFVLRNNTLKTLSGSDQFLDNVINGNITNNSVSNGYFGILLQYSSNNTLTNNLVSSNSQSGIYLYSSSNNTLTNNTANDNSWSGNRLWSSSNSNTLNNNSANRNREGVKRFIQSKLFIIIQVLND